MITTVRWDGGASGSVAGGDGVTGLGSRAQQSHHIPFALRGPDDYEEVFFAAVAAGDPHPAAYMHAAHDCITFARKQALQRAKPTAVSLLIQSAFPGAPAALGVAAPAGGDRGLPLSGMSAGEVEVEPTVSALRCERQLWALVAALFDAFTTEQCATHAALAGVAPFAHTMAAARGLPIASTPVVAAAGALPVDPVANDALATTAAATFDPHHRLLHVALDWLHSAAARDGHVVDVDGTVLTVEEARQAVASGAWGLESAIPAVTHPDTSLLDEGRVPTGGNDDGASDLARSMWNLLRCGDPVTAQLLAVRYGQPWRAAVLAGKDGWRDEEVVVRVQSLASEGDELESDLGPSTVTDTRMVRRGNPHKAEYAALAGRIAAEEEGEGSVATPSPGSPGRAGLQGLDASLARPYTTALMHALSGRTDRLLVGSGGRPAHPTITTWEDAVWACAHAAVHERETTIVSLLRAAQRAATDGVPDPLSGLSGAPPASPSEVPLTVEGVLSLVASPHLAATAPWLPVCAESDYAIIVQALFRFATALPPTVVSVVGGVPDPSTAATVVAGLSHHARLSIARALHQLLLVLRDVCLQLDEGYAAATFANRRGDDMEHPFMAHHADSLAGASSLSPAKVPTLRFVTHFLLYLRSSSHFRHEPVLKAGGPPATPVEGKDGSGMDGDALLAMEVEPWRMEAVTAVDDVVYMYLRHLATAAPNRLAHGNGILALLPSMSPPRAVRAATAFFTQLMEAPPASATDTLAALHTALGAGGGTTLLAGTATGVPSASPLEDALLRREALLNAYSHVSADYSIGAVVSVVEAGMRNAVQLALVTPIDTVPTTPPLAVRAEFERRGLPMPSLYPLPTLRKGGVAPTDAHRLSSLLWLLAGLPRWHNDLMVATNVYSRLLAPHCAAHVHAVVTSVAAGGAGGMGGLGAASGGGGTTCPAVATLRLLHGVVDGGAVLMPPLPWPALHDDFCGLVEGDPMATALVAEVKCWHATAVACGAVDAWAHAAGRSLPSPPVPPGGGRRVGAAVGTPLGGGVSRYVTGDEAAAYNAACQAYDQMVAARQVEVTTAADAAASAIAGAVDAWDGVEAGMQAVGDRLVGVVHAGDDCIVVPPVWGGEGNPTPAVRQVWLSLWSEVTTSVTTATKEWVAAHAASRT